MSQPESDRTSENPATPRRQADKWWKPQMPPGQIRELLRTRDLPGLLFFGGWLILVGCLGVLTWLARDTPLLFIPLLCLYGTVLSFSYACSHECAHRTAFHTGWLNETVYYLSSFIFGQEPVYRRYSHISHHAKTWHPGADAQMDYRNPITLSGYLYATSGLGVWWDTLTALPRRAAGRLNSEERAVIPEKELAKMIWGSRAFLAGYAALAAVTISGLSLMPLYLFFLPRFIGGWIVNFFINTQHMCMAEAVTDHRKSTRSVKCGWLSRVLYWNMNYHIEHHLLPGVPFHRLPALSDAISEQLPLPARGMTAANVDILRTVMQQRRDPHAVCTPQWKT